MILRPLIACGLLGALCISGCYSPELGVTPFRCAANGKRCPDDYQCVLNSVGTEVCMQTGTGSSNDSGQPNTDAVIGNSKDGPVYVDGATVQPSETCKDRAEEPNNSFNSATSLGDRQGVFPGWEICYPGDVDHYSVALKSGQRLTITIVFKHADGDLELVLLDPAGKVIGASRSSSNNETLVHQATAAGKYIFAVYGLAGAIAPYSIELQIDG